MMIYLIPTNVKRYIIKQAEKIPVKYEIKREIFSYEHDENIMIEYWAIYIHDKWFEYIADPHKTVFWKIEYDNIKNYIDFLTKNILKGKIK